MAGHPNLINKTNHSNKISDKHIVYSNQCLGAGHSFLHKKEEQIITVVTIMLISMMSVACKIIKWFYFQIIKLMLLGRFGFCNRGFFKIKFRKRKKYIDTAHLRNIVVGRILKAPPLFSRTYTFSDYNVNAGLIMQLSDLSSRCKGFFFMKLANSQRALLAGEIK